MAAPHAHAPGTRQPASRRVRQVLAAVLVPFLAATALGLVVLWPGNGAPELDDSLGAPQDLYDARVVSVGRGPCTGTSPDAGFRCSRSQVRLLEGPDEGEVISLQEQPDVGAGLRLEIDDTVVLGYFPGAGEGFEYSFADRQRRAPLVVLTGLFVVAVIGLGRWQGLRALLGLAASLVVLTAFVLPAVLAGSNPLAVALVGSAAIAVAALYLAHGVNAWTTTALIGTLASLALVGVLASVFVGAANFSGLANEEATFLQITAGQIDLRGLLLGGIVIGALGVLDDVTVTQVSAVWELRSANPGLRRWELYRSALRIGRDHIASTVNTLVLAYAGASLPLFLLFTQSDQGLADILNGESVAVEVVRALTGSLGLVASVPLTTVLAVLVATSGGRTPDGPPSDGAEPAPDPAPVAPAPADAPPEADSPPEAVAPARKRPTGDPRRYRSRREERFWEDDDR